MVQRGLVVEAKQKLLEYADRMRKAGRMDEAFSALREFADLSPDNEEIRLSLAEQLKAAARTEEARDQLAKLYHETQSTGDEGRSRVTLEKIKVIDPDYDPETAPKPAAKARPEKSGDLVFLDLGEPGLEPPGAAVVEPPMLDLEPTSLAETAAGEPPAEELEESAARQLGGEALAEELKIERAEVSFEGVGGEEISPLEGLDPTVFGEIQEAEAGKPEFLESEQQRPVFDRVEAQGAGIEVPELDLGVGGSLEEGTGTLAATVADLEAQVAADPENPYLRQSLGEALIEAGERERGLEELDIALAQYESGEQWSEAESIADEILRLDPNSVRHHQKRVELSYRRNDRRGLVEAYLGLADALFRNGALDRARAVYQRVLEHDPGNQRAVAALGTLEPGEPEKAAVGTGAGRPEPQAGGDFVDLTRLVLEDEEPRFRDTRLRVEDEEPTGDEQRDFEEMLNKFKEGIAATLTAEDAQAHYDLGVAFKEMGLLDEAIAEFQKALRGKEGRLRTSEALGVCFFERGQYSVAATVLRRAVESDPSGDEEKIGLLYWLGRCEEELGRQAEALAYYQRVFAVDITFRDVSQRVKSLAESGR
jgi:tetratricopeptide (TPR) repeat protein